MSLEILDSDTTQEELESAETVATETTPATLDVRDNESFESAEKLSDPQTSPAVPENRGQGSDAVSDQVPASPTSMPLDFDDEFIEVTTVTAVTKPVEDESPSDTTPMFAETAGDDWPIGEVPMDRPLDGVSVPDPKIGEIEQPASTSPRNTAEKLVAHFDKIHSLETQIAEACELELELKDRLKTLRKNREGLVERLTKLKGGEDDPDDDSDSEDCDDEIDTRDIGGEACVKPASSDAWGTDGVEALESHGLKPAKAEALRAAADAGHFNGTIKGLRDWIAKSDLWHRNVKGCGPTGAEKIGDALTSYMTAHPVADEPMTAEDEARSEAAAIALGHTKPLDETPANQESEESTVEQTQETQETQEAPANELSPSPLASNITPEKPKRTRKQKSPKSGATQKADASESSYHQANAGQLARNDAIMRGEVDPANAITNELEATQAGMAAGRENVSCSMNPFPRDHQFGKAWQAGWEATAAGAV